LPAKLGLMLGEAGLDQVGPGLREVCETIGIPPVLHMGSCVDNSRILTVLTQWLKKAGWATISTRSRQSVWRPSG
jgi:anaerobic carbon-monoxide dehydrogenase catalytic subunit